MQTSVMQNHIATLAGLYAGKIYADVCNKIFNEDCALRSSVFSNILGQDFVRIAYQAPRVADPTVILYLNDYNLGMINLANSVSSGGTRYIDALGTQVHLYAGGTGGVQATLTALASTGLDVAITELDISGGAASDYVTVAKACLNTAKCVKITSWGVSDTNSWRASSTPLLFDSNYQPKATHISVI
ncbi:glycoside hydrolase family 10 protein [Sphaerobolus stellatus SS14]|uniref:Glycoside hydrolase family 10 protein n=1 Tax=Sphaerobolus stellatus (strain SS14) TaxID=990650 RepID=A0A0C9U7T7_SPHS4|nr:glycoside hydrolase family 10 protein [Sphaerobolus stellatus SS14]